MLPKIKSVIGKIVRFLNRKIIFIFGFLFLLIVFLLTIRIIVPIQKFIEKTQLSPSFFTRLATDKEYPLKKTGNRTNFLLLGIAGKNHEGADLTDTMIFLSVDFDKNDVFMVSLPRDIWLESLKDKINTAYHYGEERETGGGFVLGREAVEEVVGQPIHYVVLLDFDGFKKIIDDVGGLDVEVENAFVDEKYPLAGRENDLCDGDKELKCRFETIKFEKGLQHMDGETALKFVRSRNAEGDEGTDFARSQRQQKVITAFQKKLLNPENLTFEKAASLEEDLKSTVKTDLSLSEIAYLGKFALLFKGQIRSVPLDWGNKNEDGFLVNPPLEKYDRWVLVPASGSFAEIQKYISCNLESPDCSITPAVHQ